VKFEKEMMEMSEDFVPVFNPLFEPAHLLCSSMDELNLYT